MPYRIIFINRARRFRKNIEYFYQSIRRLYFTKPIKNTKYAPPFFTDASVPLVYCAVAAGSLRKFASRARNLLCLRHPTVGVAVVNVNVTVELRKA